MSHRKFDGHLTTTVTTQRDFRRTKSETGSLQSLFNKKNQMYKEQRFKNLTVNHMGENYAVQTIGRTASRRKPVANSLETSEDDEGGDSNSPTEAGPEQQPALFRKYNSLGRARYNGGSLAERYSESLIRAREIRARNRKVSESGFPYGGPIVRSRTQVMRGTRKPEETQVMIKRWMQESAQKYPVYSKLY